MLWQGRVATSYDSVACMTSGGGAYPWVNVQYSTAGFNHVCSPLCSTTCLSGGYPVTLICWHYTKHWSLSTCSYFKKYGLKQYFMWRRTLSARQRPLPLLLLYNYLITNNTLQLFCDSPSPFVGFFFSFFGIFEFYKLSTVLKSDVKAEADD